jgi:hypothetical protein
MVSNAENIENGTLAIRNGGSVRSQFKWTKKPRLALLLVLQTVSKSGIGR